MKLFLMVISDCLVGLIDALSKLIRLVLVLIYLIVRLVNLGVLRVGRFAKLLGLGSRDSKSILVDDGLVVLGFGLAF